MTQKTDDVLNAWEHLLAEIQAHGVHHNIHAGTLDTLNKFIRTQPPQDGWRSMESAPRDGTDILGYSPTHGIRSNLSFNKARQDFDLGFSCLARDWTHWQPLPAPPQPAKTNGDKL